MPDDTRSHSSSSATWLPILIAIVGVGVSVFMFLLQYKTMAKQPEVYYQIDQSRVTIPESLDRESVLELLRAKGIPDSTLALRVINKGNGPAEEVNITVGFPGEIVTASIAPRDAKTVAWLKDIHFDASKGDTNAACKLTEFGTGRAVRLDFGYAQQTAGSLPKVEVFCAGVPASRVPLLGSVEDWSAWRLFALPLKVLGGAVALALLAAFILVMLNFPGLGRQMRLVLWVVVRQALGLRVLEEAFREVTQSVRSAQGTSPVPGINGTSAAWFSDTQSCWRMLHGRWNLTAGAEPGHAGKAVRFSADGGYDDGQGGRDFRIEIVAQEPPRIMIRKRRGNHIVTTEVLEVMNDDRLEGLVGDCPNDLRVYRRMPE